MVVVVVGSQSVSRGCVVSQSTPVCCSSGPAVKTQIGQQSTVRSKYEDLNANSTPTADRVIAGLLNKNQTKVL